MRPKRWANMEKTVSFWHRLFDLIAPRSCPICGSRLGLDEKVICSSCNLRLPRTYYAARAYDNEMAKTFWRRIPIERAAALFFYQPRSQVAEMVYQLKYRGHYEMGESMGEMTAKEFDEMGFFEGIDIILPIPLARKRQRQRGYNQSVEIARGVSKATGIAMRDDIVVRTAYHGSQINKDRWARLDNVENLFMLKNGAAVHGKHILLVDDIVTSGATVIACGTELMKAEDVKISVLALGFTKT